MDAYGRETKLDTLTNVHFDQADEFDGEWQEKATAVNLGSLNGPRSNRVLPSSQQYNHNRITHQDYNQPQPNQVNYSVVGNEPNVESSGRMY